MAKGIRHILLAISGVRHAPKSELRKAAALARAARADIELFHVMDEPDPGRSFPETATAAAVGKLRADIAGKYRQRLERFARDESLSGVRVTCTASWDYPPHEAIIRRALATRTDLVIAATRHHIPGGRLLLRNTDWELIRHCPVPLLLMKSRRPYRKAVVLAAVDPFHRHARPADLDKRLLDTGGLFARLLHGTLHIFHAYMPLITVQPPAMTAVAPVLVPQEIEDAHGKQIGRAIRQLADTVGISRTRTHVYMGDVAGELGAATTRTGANIVVLGAVSRSALARVFIGNTAERVLERLKCDLLVVKPRGFKSKVAGPRAVVRRKRQMPATAVRTRRGEPQSTVAVLSAVLPPLL